MEDMFLELNAVSTKHEEVREKYIRGPFPYPGSKYKALDKILPRLPYSKSYCEPFGGSGAVLLNRNPSPLETFNDRHSGITAFYRCIRDSQKCQQLIERCQLAIHSREEFIWCKENWKSVTDDVERAARWYYLVCSSFSGQGRNFARNTNTKAQTGNRIHDGIDRFWQIHERLKNVQVENLDWRQCFNDFDSVVTVWYLDPPYLDVWSGTYEWEMKREEHRELLERIFNLKGFVAISGYPNELYNSYKWDQIFSWEQRTSLLGKAYTETNGQLSRQNQNRNESSIEMLYIKEAYV